MTEDSFFQLKEAAKSGNGFAITQLAVQCIECATSDLDLEEGMTLLEMAVGKNVIWAKDLIRGIQSGVATNPVSHHVIASQDAINQMKHYIARFDMWAATTLGILWWFGHSTARKPHEASTLLSWSSQKGCLWAREFMEEENVASDGDIASSNLIKRVQSLMAAKGDETFYGID